MSSLRDGDPEEQPRFSMGSMALSDEPGRLGYPQSQSGNPSGEVLEAHGTNLDETIAIMRTAAINEQFTPDILKYQTEVVDSIRTLVKQQTETLDEDEDESNQGVSFESQLKRLELDRLNYLLRQYYRVRIKKVENQILFLFKDSVTYDLLSPQEQNFAVGYSDLVEEHFKKSFLSMLPEKVRVLDKDGTVDHASGPNLDQFVFCRVKNSVGRVAIGEDAADDTLELNYGDILCIRYKGIQELLKNEDVELI